MNFLALFCALLMTVSSYAYQALNAETVKEYLATQNSLVERLGEAPWASREVGDGNLNLVFIIEGPKGSVVVKQSLPYVRLVGESWPLPLSRANFEHMALVEQAKVAPQYVPAIYHHDDEMYLTVMEYLSPHIILRKGMVRGIVYPDMAPHLGEFMAKTLFYTSDLFLSADAKREKMARFSTNNAMCKITEDLVFDEPYFNAPLNSWTTPQLDDIAMAFREDTALKLAAQEMKWRFLNQGEALIHGDLHTGSVMVTEKDTRVIDAEFAFYGPMGFDVGAVLGNLLLAYFSQPGHEQNPGDREVYAEWILEQIPRVWDTFAQTFTHLWKKHHQGDVYAARLNIDMDLAIKSRLNAIWRDTIGFAGVKMIRRILGLAHVEDFKSIADPDRRAACERRALQFARTMLVDRWAYLSPAILIGVARLAP